MTKKLLYWALLSCLISSPVFAGGILTNTNQSIHFLRNPARGASTEIDAVYTNPAGLSFLPSDGFHFSFTNQSAFQTRTITTTFAPFIGFGKNETKEFKGKASAPIIPSLQAAYKKGNWVLSGSIAVTGGGGKATFNEGLPSFESQIAMLPILLSSPVDPSTGNAKPAFPTSQYSVDAYMEGSSFIFGGQLGGTYKINDMFSVYGGFRMNIVSNSYVGHLKNININPDLSSVTIPGLPAAAMDALRQKYNGKMVNASEFLTTLGQTEQAKATQDKYLESEQSGWGVTPILGVNFHWNRLNVGVKYEFITNLNVENKTKIDDTNMFADGVNTAHDIPALLTVGASYALLPSVSVSAGYHHFFDSDASMAEVTDPSTGIRKGKQHFIDGGTNEYLGGIEWQINKMFLVSGGVQFTRTGVTDPYQQDLSFSLNSYSVGIGGAVNVSETVRLNVGYFFTNYSDWTKDFANNYNGSGMSGKDVFSRTNKVFGVGVDFRF